MGRSQGAVSGVLHVVVGSGNVPYFLNAVRSLQNLGAGDVFATYNFVNEADKEAIESIRGEVGEGVTLDVLKNDTSKRTGSLYEANNNALAFARDRYGFVSFLQADMQVMWWNPVILSSARKLVQSLAKPSNVSFYTQLPVLGKHSRPYLNWSRDEKRNVYRSVGHVDVCLLPIFDGLNSDFVFEGTEKSMSEERSRQSATLFLHPYPFIAPIPFPSTLRDPGWADRDRARRIEFPILRVNTNFDLNFGARELHPFSMETSVTPNQWSCLFPFWPSDTRTNLWLYRRIEYCRLYGKSIFSVIDSRGKVSPLYFRGFSPGPTVLGIALLVFVFRESGFTIRRQISYLTESFRRLFGLR